MKFTIHRTSYSPPHVNRHYERNKTRKAKVVDEPIFEPEQYGLEHIVDSFWTIEIDSLEQLLELSKIVGHDFIVGHRDHDWWAEVKGLAAVRPSWDIEIYDGYRE